MCGYQHPELLGKLTVQSPAEYRRTIRNLTESLKSLLYETMRSLVDETIFVLSFILSLALGCGKQSDRGPGKTPKAGDDSKATAAGELPVLGQVPAFLLTDQDRQPFAKAQLDGHLGRHVDFHTLRKYVPDADR